MTKGFQSHTPAAEKLTTILFHPKTNITKSITRIDRSPVSSPQKGFRDPGHKHNDDCLGGTGVIERDRENERDNVGPLNQALCCCSQGLYVLREKEDRERGGEGERTR